jgi:hypothetical protein
MKWQQAESEKERHRRQSLEPGQSPFHHRGQSTSLHTGSYRSWRRLIGSTEVMQRAALAANCRGELLAVARMATPRAAHCHGWTSGCRADGRDRQRVPNSRRDYSRGMPRKMLGLAHGPVLPRGDAGTPGSSGCLLFGNEGRNCFPLYPVDLRAKICAALPDLVGGR